METQIDRMIADGRLRPCEGSGCGRVNLPADRLCWDCRYPGGYPGARRA